MLDTRSSFLVVAASGALALGLLAPPAAGQACGVLEAIANGGDANGVSADGSVVVGRAFIGSDFSAFRWTAATGAQAIASPGGAGAVSADGSVVVGVSGDLFMGNQRAFRWTAATGAVDLGTLGGGQSFASDVSADGSVVVGAAQDAANRYRAFRWTATTGMQDLGALAWGTSEAAGVSADGTTVVGAARDGAFRYRAFRWTAATGLQPIGVLGPNGYSYANAVSANGSVIVGSSTSVGNGTESAFRWTQATGMEDLGSVRSSPTFAEDVSDDGRTIVGRTLTFPEVFNSFRWTQDTGPVELYALNGDPFLVNACTPDARVLVGRGEVAGLTGSTRLPLCWIGAGYCGPAVVNSTERNGFIRASGSDVVAANALEISAYALPDNANGYFLASRQRGFVFPVSMSQGALCLGGAIGRFVGAGQVQNSGSTGSFTLAVDLTAMPTPTGLVAAQPGETWHFQAWHRDVNPMSTSNFTDGVSVTLR
ncbi:MAG: hypothetical protein AAF957_03550 [Planctomycetota bacterium]